MSTADTVIADNGKYVPVGSLAKQVHRDVNGKIDYIEVEWRSETYRKTITRDVNGNIESTGNVYEWELQ